MKKIIFFALLLFFNFHSGQKATIGRLESMFGIWEDKESDYSLKLEISKNNDTNDFLFALINSRGEKFIVNKSHIFENDNKAIVIEIEEAKLSTCNFNSGKMIIASTTENKLLLNLNDVPKCSTSYDTSVTIDDVKDILLTKKQ
ncbi:hypothetical protein [Epilithonimonas sp.]|uniref:hypothetical protein n=1 Tax=Epilithonimonas sp. TaxID=2894511 RepID=UPI0035B3374C